MHGSQDIPKWTDESAILANFDPLVGQPDFSRKKALNKMLSPLVCNFMQKIRKN